MIKWFIKWILRLVVFVAVLVILFLAFKDSIWRTIAEHRIRSQTGMEARIGKLSTGLFSPVITIENLKLYNTAEFGGTLFLEIPELHLELNSLSLAQRQLRITLARINLAELDIVKNEAGQTNITSLLTQMQPNASAKTGRTSTPLGDLEFDGIDVLNLSFGKVRFLDLKDRANNREIRVGMQNQIFKNVKSEGDAYAILFMLWLRSGGKLSISPDALAQDYLAKQREKIESTVRKTLDQPTAPNK